MTKAIMMNLRTNMGARTRKPRTRAVPDREPLAITPSRRHVLELLRDYRHLTPTMLGQLYSAENGRGEKHVQNELGRLFHNGLVIRHYHATRPAGEGSDPFIYALSPDGARAVLSPEEWRERRRSIWARGEPKQNYGHHLAVSALQAILTLGSDPWRVEEFVADHEDQGTRIRVEIARLGHRTLWPDAEAVLRFPNGQRALYLFEIDRARKSNARTDERFRAYAAHLGGRRLERIKVEREVSGAVVVFAATTAPDVRRLVLRAHALVSGGQIPPPRPFFLFWNTESWYQRATGNGVGGRFVEPREVLAEENVLTLTGTRRRLVQSTP